MGEASDAQRSVLSESARISRCAVKSLSVLKQDDAMALVIPGGFGAAKNLSDFGFKGEFFDFGLLSHLVIHELIYCAVFRN